MEQDLYRKESYSMTITLGILEGDGIGHEIMPAVDDILTACEDRTGVDIKRVELPIGWESYDQVGSSLPTETIEGLAECDGWILGPLLIGEYPEDDDNPASPSGRLRTEFDLYANIRPVRSYEGITAQYDEIELIIFRQNTEGFYADRNLEVGAGEFKPTANTVLSLRVVTRKESRRIAERAFEYVDEHPYMETVTAVHKSNVLTLGDGLFLDALL